ncbi:diacylglycerol kinase family protein [Streptomyces lydicus]|uniref:diacylglycerol kinase family protein n=1 Tax=Streptomyces lydicus TaxID=47763 RepID=UPI0037B6C1B9
MDSVRGHPLLVVIDPVARSTDGESVRIAKDVLCAGAGAKICLPEGPEEFARALARRGQRRPVVIGDDRALLRVVSLLDKQRQLTDVPVSMVPVGAPATVALSRALGVPTDTVTAARTVLDGGERSMDLLRDDSDGIVLGALRIPCAAGGHDAVRHLLGPQVPRPAAPRDPVEVRAATEGWGGAAAGEAGAPRPWWRPAARTARTALALLAPAAGRRARVPAQRLRIEADGVLLADLDRPVRGVSVVPGARPAAGAGAGAGGELAEVVVHWAGEARPVRARARAVTVSGADFHYRADAVVGGPVRTRTWTVQAGAWRLQLPHSG